MCVFLSYTFVVTSRYAVKGNVWLWPGENGAWHFVHVDKKTSTWKTSIFPDKRSGTYLLPLKASVRRAEAISEGDTIAFTLEI